MVEAFKEPFKPCPLIKLFGKLTVHSPVVAIFMILYYAFKQFLYIQRGLSPWPALLGYTG